MATHADIVRCQFASLSVVEVLTTTTQGYLGSNYSLLFAEQVPVQLISSFHSTSIAFSKEDLDKVYLLLLYE